MAIMSEGLFGYFFGAFSVMVLIAGLQHLNPDSAISIVAKAKTECEKSLPRDQKCIIIAVPPSKD